MDPKKRIPIITMSCESSESDNDADPRNRMAKKPIRKSTGVGARPGGYATNTVSWLDGWKRNAKENSFRERACAWW